MTVKKCWIGLGGNQGDVAATFESTLVSLNAVPGLRVVARSSLFDTAPVGAEAGRRYVNAAAALETTLAPHALLAQLQQAEASAGRVRAIHWGPRTLDLDLLLYGDQVIWTPTLVAPHPALWYRRFVLDPLCELAHNVQHPTFGMTIARLRERLLARPLPVSIDADLPHADSLRAALSPRFSVQIQFTSAPEQAAIAFAPSACAHEGAAKTDPASQLPQLIVLREKCDATSEVAAVLTAALDEPRPYRGPSISA